MESLWTYAEDVRENLRESMTGFTVEAPDGAVGAVDRQADDAGRAHLVVDTGMWVFGESVLVPAGIVTSIDPMGETIRVGVTRDEIKNAPRFTTDKETQDLRYLESVGDYYARLRADRALEEPTAS
jgi:hypothetical protein